MTKNNKQNKPKKLMWILTTFEKKICKQYVLSSVVDKPQKRRNSKLEIQTTQ